MPLFPKRVSRKKIGRFKPPAASPAPPIERLVEESRLIAYSAARMTLKNHIIVNVLQGRRDFDEDALIRYARARLLQLAAEQEAVADREQGVDRRRVRRIEVLTGLAASLRADAERPEVLADVVEQARASAWDEVEGSLHARLEGPEWVADPDPAYAEERDERLATFLALDLAPLALDRGIQLD